MKIQRVLISVGVLVLLIVDGAVAYTVGSTNGRAEAASIRAEFFQGRTGTGQNGGTPQTQNPSAAQTVQAARGQTGQSGQFPQGAQNVRGLNGTVKSVSGSVVVVALQDGNLVDVTVDSQTQIQKTGRAALTDIQPGMNITVVSDQNPANNKVTARTIQLRGDQ